MATLLQTLQRLETMMVGLKQKSPDGDLGRVLERLEKLDDRLEQLTGEMEQLRKQLKTRRPPPSQKKARPPPLRAPPEQPQGSFGDMIAKTWQPVPMAAAAVVYSQPESKRKSDNLAAISKVMFQTEDGDEEEVEITQELHDNFWMWLLRTITWLDDGMSESIPIYKVREKIQDEGFKKAFDTLLLELAQEGKVALEPHPSPKGLSAEERDGSVSGPDGLLYSIKMSLW